MARQPGLGNAFRLTELHHDLRDLSKLFSTEMYQKDACELMDLFAPESLFRDDEDLAEVGLGYRQSICMTIYGGTSEEHRSR